MESLRTLIASTERPDWSARQVAVAAVRKFRRDHPDEWEAWVEKLATDEVVELVSSARRSRRGIFRMAERRQTLRAAVESGDFSPFEEPFVVDLTGTSKALGDLQRDDCVYVATRH